MLNMLKSNDKGGLKPMEGTHQEAMKDLPESQQQQQPGQQHEALLQQGQQQQGQQLKQ